VYWLKKTIVEQAVNRLRAELAESGSNMTDSQRDHVITVLNKHATNVLQEWSGSKGSPETVGKMFQTMDENNVRRSVSFSTSDLAFFETSKILVSFRMELLKKKSS